MKPILPLFLIAALAAADAQSSSDVSVMLSKTGFQIPKTRAASLDFTLPGLDGKKVKLSSLKGSLVLLNFWATWCPPCREEIPSMESLYRAYKDKGVRILAVDLAEDRGKVEDFVKKNKMGTTVLLDSSGQVGGLYAVESIPTTYIVGKDGDILGRVIGGRDWGSPEIKNLFDTLLALKQ